METVLILALLHLMPTRRVQCWVRAQGLRKESNLKGSEQAQSSQLTDEEWEDAAEILSGYQGAGIFFKERMGLKGRAWRDERVSKISPLN